MALFLISYDLDSPGQNYEAVYRLLRSWGAQRVLESTWMLKANNTSCAAMRDAMMPSNNGPLDSNDRVVVVEVHTWAVWRAMININDL